LLIIGGGAVRNGFFCALGYAGLPVVFAIGLKDTIRTGAMLTTWRAYHRSREPIRYWLGVAFLTAVLGLFVVTGIEVLLREGPDGFIPRKQSLGGPVPLIERY
jgi:hypothetical protein